MADRMRIGISGWNYPPWRGGFYPKGLRQKDELSHAARQFGSIEINGTFYGLQKPESFIRWRDETPEDFVFSVKGPRYITHELRLKEVETPLANFLASGLLALGSKLGPILWQFPPSMRFDAGRFQQFLGMLPHTAQEALALARRHDDHVAGRTWLQFDGKQPIRHAVEIRHDSFKTPEFIQLLRRHDIALVCADAVDWPLLTDLTSDFVYCRLHGAEELYVSGYDDEALDRWAARIRLWAQGDDPEAGEHVVERSRPFPAGRDVFVYFDNTFKKSMAPVNAASLRHRIDIKSCE